MQYGHIGKPWMCRVQLRSEALHDSRALTTRQSTRVTTPHATLPPVRAPFSHATRHLATAMPSDRACARAHGNQGGRGLSVDSPFLPHETEQQPLPAAEYADDVPGKPTSALIWRAVGMPGASTGSALSATRASKQWRIVHAARSSPPGRPWSPARVRARAIAASSFARVSDNSSSRSTMHSAVRR